MARRITTITEEEIRRKVAIEYIRKLAKMDEAYLMMPAVREREFWTALTEETSTRVNRQILREIKPSKYYYWLVKTNTPQNDGTTLYLTGETENDEWLLYNGKDEADKDGTDTVRMRAEYIRLCPEEAWNAYKGRF